VTAALRLAQQQVGQGDFRGALTTAAGGLKTDPQNTALKALVRDVAARARQQATAAQTSAARLGEAVTGLRAFRDGQAKMNEAQGYARAGRQDRAAASLWDATDLFARAEREAAEARARAAAAAAAAPAPASAETQPPVAAREEPVAAKPLPLPPPAPSPTPAPAPASAASSSPAASPTPSPPSEEPAIRAALQAYEEAYIARDVEAVKRIYPTVNEAALQRSFRDMLAQEVRIEAEEISITGNTAVVTGRVRQSFTPRAGSRRTDVIASVFRLQKMGNRWVIVERR
jgi:ketosteroid isomerase-like protein